MEGNPTPHAVAAECRLHLSVCTPLVLTFGSQGVGAISSPALLGHSRTVSPEDHAPLGISAA